MAKEDAKTEWTPKPREAEAHVRGSVTARNHFQGRALRRAYAAGFRDGQAEAQKRLQCAARTNAQLWPEVLRLDDDHPVGDTSVVLPRDFAERLLAALDKPGPHPTFKKLLNQYITRASRSTRKLVEKLKEVVDGGPETAG